MDEVSVDTAIKLFIRKCDADGPPFATLLDGVPYSESDLRYHKKRIDWEEFLSFMQNVARTWNRSELEQLGRDYVRTSATKAARMVGRIMFSPRDFYRWAITKGHAPSTFTCISGTFRDLGRNRLQIVMKMKEGYTSVPEFFYVTKGVYTHIPCVIGYPESTVTMRLEEDQAVYDIQYVNRMNISTFLRKIIQWPLTIFTAGKELKKTLESLQESYVEVVEARNNLERRVEERTAELKQVQEAKDRVFTNISHEFRTPLTLIQGPVENMLSEENREDRKEQYRMILKNTHRLLRLVNQLLDLSKLDSGLIRPDIEKIDIIEFIRDRASSFESLALLKDITFSVVTPDTPVIEWINCDCIEKIVINLLSNAFKFTDKGGTVTLSLTLLYPQGFSNFSTVDDATGLPHIEIKVIDTGIGIDPDLHDKIFDRFYQAEPFGAEQEEGSGIGLSIVKDIVEICKGEISVSSEPGKGSTFIVRMPLRMGIDSKVVNEVSDLIGSQNGAEVQQKLKNNKQKISASSPRVLIVEDNADMRKYIRRSLTDMYTVIEATNGAEGFAKAVQTDPDLIISDVMMPVSDGIEFCKTIKTNWETSHIPVILLTAKASDEDRMGGLETGADDYLTKPFNKKELLIRIRNLLEQRKRLKEKFSKEIKITPDALTSNSLDHDFLNRALNIAKENLSNAGFDSEAFAKEMYLSRSQLHRKLQAITGLSTGEFLRSFRLKHAAQLLSGDRYSITQIAFEVGFNSPSHFTKAFRQEFNCLPSEFKTRVTPLTS